MLRFFQTGVFSTPVASQQSSAAISSLLAAMLFFAVRWKVLFCCTQHWAS